MARSENSVEETYLEVDAEGKDGTGPATAAVLESVAQTLREAPDDYRCNFELVVVER